MAIQGIRGVGGGWGVIKPKRNIGSDIKSSAKPFRVAVVDDISIHTHIEFTLRG